jgi:hypothetical protein
MNGATLPALSASVKIAESVFGGAVQAPHSFFALRVYLKDL